MHPETQSAAIESDEPTEVFDATPATPPVLVFEAEEIVEDIVVVDERGWVRWAFEGTCSAIEWSFGAAALFFGLAILSTFPILQFLSLGYLLEASGRISRSGRLRDGFVGVRKAARVGSLVAGTWLCMQPLQLVSMSWYSAYLIDPTSSITLGWRIFQIILTVLTIGHILWAWYRGGKFRHFFWPAPIKFVKRMIRGGKYVEARDAVWGYIVSLRLPYYFWLGARGFAGAIAWLFVPVVMFIGFTTIPQPAGGIIGFLGAMLLVGVLIPLPFLQAQFAAERKMTAMFDIVAVIRLFSRAPIAFALSLVVTLVFAVPLYLLKVEIMPREVMIFPSLVFIAFIYPARILTGWSLGLARKRKNKRATIWRAICISMSFGVSVPVVMMFVFILFFTRYTSWHGVYSTFEQHAFLVPVPFIGM